MQRVFVIALLMLSCPLVLAAAAAKAVPTVGSTYLAGELAQQQTGPAAPAAPHLAPILLDVTVSLALVLLLIYGVYWALLKWRAKQGLGTAQDKVGLIKVLERHLIDGRHSLAVVELGDELVYLGLADDISVLSRISDPEAVARQKQQASLPISVMGFQEQLARIGLRLKKDQWRKAKDDIKAQGQQLDSEIARIRPGRRKEGS